MVMVPNGQKKYEPLEIIEIIEIIELDDLDSKVVECLIKYGIENVRGGKYEEIILNNNDIVRVRKDIWKSKKCCTNCGRNEHDEFDCSEKIDILGNMLIDEEYIFCDICQTNFQDDEIYNEHRKNCLKKFNKVKSNNRVCHKCGKSGHDMKFCKTKKIP